MTQPTQITEPSYGPDADLAALLEAFGARVEVDYNDRTTTELPAGLTAQREHYRAYIDSPETGIDGTRTIASFGTVVSLSGHLGFAAAQLLINARVFGSPTLLYMDDAPPPDGWGERYQDVTAEWYRPEAVDAGLPEARRESRPGGFSAAEIAVGELETWARRYLDDDEPSER